MSWSNYVCFKKKKKSKISKFVTANLNTVAIRFPKNRTIRKILKEISFPLAIPSANKSSGLSPVQAVDVAEEFNKKLKFIFDGGKSNIGIESTVIDLTGVPKILRPGIISRKEINTVIKCKVKNSNNSKIIKSPGLMKKHYSPGIPMKLNQKKIVKNHAFITFGKKHQQSKNIFNLSKKSNLKDAARNLYSTLRKIKKMNFRKIYVIKIPNKGVGVAINDRLKRAAN